MPLYRDCEWLIPLDSPPKSVPADRAIICGYRAQNPPNSVKS
ncbi:hypothetical protein THTE_0043 [Thermogutta terrifontis]|uniref:Uncharacterized protein n=1 Tax=Thermogutta terrifontis TaxID=1331910 RepID=A0A286R9K7_9BACT|nr:hypothetical protein THTE_0043 [Thermogutta terrifontis]